MDHQQWYALTESFLLSFPEAMIADSSEKVKDALQKLRRLSIGEHLLIKQEHIAAYESRNLVCHSRMSYQWKK